MAQDYVFDIQRFTTAQTFFRANRGGIADPAGIKAEDVAKFNSIVYGPDIEMQKSKNNAQQAASPVLPDNANQADRISFTLKLLKFLPEL
jgi:hypothetical protein